MAVIASTSVGVYPSGANDLEMTHLVLFPLSFDSELESFLSSYYKDDYFLSQSFLEEEKLPRPLYFKDRKELLELTSEMRKTNLQIDKLFVGFCHGITHPKHGFGSLDMKYNKSPFDHHWYKDMNAISLENAFLGKKFERARYIVSDSYTDLRLSKELWDSFYSDD